MLHGLEFRRHGLSLTAISDLPFLGTEHSTTTTLPDSFRRACTLRMLRPTRSMVFSATSVCFEFCVVSILEGMVRISYLEAIFYLGPDFLGTLHYYTHAPWSKTSPFEASQLAHLCKLSVATVSLSVQLAKASSSASNSSRNIQC